MASLLLLVAALVAVCHARSQGSTDLLATHRQQHRALAGSCQWECDVCDNCLSFDGGCQLYGAPGTRCRMLTACQFGPLVFQANQTLEPPEAWPCIVSGQTSGVCTGCPPVRSPPSPPPPSPVPPPPSPPPHPAPPSPANGGGACSWMCDSCNNCKKQPSGVCLLHGEAGSSCRMLTDCLFGPIMFRANQSLTPPETWTCTTEQQPTGLCNCSSVASDTSASNGTKRFVRSRTLMF